MPFFFLLVDSWLLSAGGAGVVELAGCAVVRSEVPVVPGGLELPSDGDRTGSVVFALGCSVGERVPGVTVSTVAVLPAPVPPIMPRVDGPPKLSVSSPVSLAGVIVGGPL
jgi:hypothetical protein